MARFGLYKDGKLGPAQEYDGDRMIQYVQIVIDRPGNNVEVVAMIKLGDGEHIKKVLR